MSAYDPPWDVDLTPEQLARLAEIGRNAENDYRKATR